MNGILLVNKPYGCTSRDVVNIISKEFKTKKVGHTGTLDPIATGVLVVPIGRALKVSELLTADIKEYEAEVILGFETDTLDITGKETKRNKPDVSLADIKSVLKQFVGVQKQEVPMYSAVKVNGKKLYEYARSGSLVTAPIKEIEVFDLSLVGDVIYNENTTQFKIKCTVSKGTYIRALIRDIGIKLGTYGTMKSLIRTRQGPFGIEECFSLDDIKNGKYKILSIREALPKIPIKVIEEPILSKVKNGMVLDAFFEGEMALLVSKEDKEIAIYKREVNGKVKPFKMIEV